MSQFLKSIQPTLNEIVCDITGLTLTDRFNPYKKLFEDSIIHRGYVSIEKKHVDQHLQGLKKKFYVHAQDKKGDLLEYLVKHFYNRPLFGHGPESNLHYACLQLVIELASKPLEVNIDHFTDLVHEQIAEANFDWRKYLLGPQVENVQIDENDNESIDEETNDLTEILHDQTTDIGGVEEEKTIDDLEEQNCLSLKRDLITSYWHRTIGDDVSPSLRDFALFWDENMMKTTHLLYRVNCQTISEYIVIRESLWLLMNITPLHIFTIGENHRVDVADFVRLCDVTPVTLQNYLKEIVHLANQFQKTKEFLRQNHRSCRTLASFAEILQDEMMIIEYQLADIERHCIEQKSTFTLLSFHQQLESLGIFSKGKCFERIFDEFNDFLHLPNCDLTLELIHLLYKNLLIAEMLNHYEFFNFFLNLFIGSCRIYFQIIENWLTNGTLNDPFDEFFIKRKSEIDVDSMEFWASAYTEQVQNATLIPKWLATVVPSLIKAGKCAEILKFNRILFQTDEKEHFFDDFLSHLCNHLNLSTNIWNPFVPLGNSSHPSTSKPFISFKLDFDDIDNEKNSFLALAFQRMQKSPSNLLRTNRRKYFLPTTKTFSMNLEFVLQNFTKEILFVRCENLIRRLTDDFLYRLKYLEHIDGIRGSFLFENGSLMHQFAVRLYAKLSQTIHERLDAFTVIGSFDSALSMLGMKKSDSRLSVIYQSSNESNSSTLKYIIQNVLLKYDLPKEFFFIIQPEQMEIYQKCFAFVLQVKQAKHLLDQLVFIEFRVKTRLRNHRLYRHQSYHLHHQMFLLRARLLHAVNAVNNFVLTTFHTAGEEFVAKHREKRLDIELMIDFHEKFLTALSIGALLQPKQQPIRDQLMKLFEIVAVFARRWQLGFDSIRLEHIQKLHHEFQQCKQFISTVLKPFLPRMIDSPLRALACALQDDFTLT